MKECEAKPGDILELEDGRTGIFLSGGVVQYFNGKYLCSWDRLRGIRSFIVGVYRPKHSDCWDIEGYKGCSEEIYSLPKEMTLAEVSEALGYEVKIVEEKEFDKQGVDI